MGIGSRGDAWSVDEQVAADRGWTVGWANGTPDTGIIVNADQTFSNTKACFMIQNEAPLGSSITVAPKWFTLSCTVADVAGTSARLYGVVDSKLRFSSGGSQLIAPEFGYKRPDLNGVAAGSVPAIPGPFARVQFGNITVAAPSGNKQNVNSRIIKTQATPQFNVGDQVTFVFGRPVTSGQPLNAAAAASHVVVYLGAVSLPPQTSYVLHYWEPAQTTAPTFEIDGEHLEA